MSLVRIARSLALSSALLAGCGAQIADGVTNSGSTGDDTGNTMPPDASTGSGGGSSTPIDAAPAATCNQRALFLNFGGQALTKALASDATKNQASWMNTSTGTAPAYHNGDGNRDNDIQTIVDGVKSQLSTFPVTVVTTRPTSGDYVMVVLGGTRTNVGSDYGAAVNTLDCGDLTKNDVAWIADNVSPNQHVINLVIGAVGFGLGLTATSDPNDCMCGWANNCNSNDNAACKLGAPVNRDQTADQLCASAGATQNEVTAIHDAFCGK